MNPEAREVAAQLVELLDSLTPGERTALLADLHNMAADLPPGVRRLLAEAFKDLP